MNTVEKILKQIETSLISDTFKSVETERIELKDLSTGDKWKELYISTCAFLNTDGGIIFVGINEKSNTYKLTGFDDNNEGKIKELTTKFTDENGNKLDLKDYFPAFEIHDLLDKRVCVIYVDNLPEDEKFVFYERAAYERKLTGDHKISDNAVLEQRERKEEIQTARELTIVEQATLEDLDVDKLNNYLILLNRDVKIESIKADINSALSFLNRKSFVRDNLPTLLGMLVCGNHIYDFIEGRCQVDCFVDSKFQVAQNKRVLKDNIIPLMESSFSFVFNNIQVGVSNENFKSLQEILDFGNS